MTTQIISGPSGQLASYSAGNPTKPAIVFIHGDLGRASQWDAVISLLAKNRNAIAYDCRGHGDSEPARDGDYGFSARASDLATIVQHYELTDYVLVAHSGGAGAVLEFATKAQGLSGIFLVDPATDPRAMPREMRDGFLAALKGPAALDAIQGYYASIAGPNSKTVAHILTDAATAHETARFGVAKALAFWNPEPSLNNYNGPVGMLVTPPNDTDAALYYLRSDMAHTVIGTSGHWPHLDTPQVVADAIRQFIDGLDSN
jgi:pimeloyl-ACP methyl ester carboxylesterase